jgi:hypothetical protein
LNEIHIVLPNASCFSFSLAQQQAKPRLALVALGMPIKMPKEPATITKSLLAITITVDCAEINGCWIWKYSMVQL